eukprot:gene15206-16978_t
MCRTAHFFHNRRQTCSTVKRVLIVSRHGLKGVSCALATQIPQMPQLQHVKVAVSNSLHASKKAFSYCLDRKLPGPTASASVSAIDRPRQTSAGKAAIGAVTRERSCSTVKPVHKSTASNVPAK